MIPTFIVPHPFLRKAIVVLQSVKDVTSFRPALEHEYKRIEKDFTNVEKSYSYQILLEIFK